MPLPRRTLPVLTALLVFTALAQAAVLSWRHRPLQAEAAPVQIARGDVLEVLTALDTLGAEVDLSLRNGDLTGTLFLVFNSECPYTADVLPLWDEWLAASRGVKVKVIGITPDPPDVAAKYRRENGWDIEVLSIREGDPVGEALVSRTPWLIYFSAAGELQFSDHGNTIGTTDSLMAVVTNLMHTAE